MNIMIRKGSVDNVATYEHYCDTMADRTNIDKKEITLGSKCTILEGKSGKVEVYIANSKKEWFLIETIESGAAESDVPAESETKPNKVVSIEDAAALTDLINSDTAKVSVKLSQPLSAASAISVPSGKEVTINLNGQTVEAESILFNIKGGTVTLNGSGTVNTKGNIAVVTEGGKIVVNGGTYDSTASNCGIGASGEGSTIEFNNGELTTIEAGLMAFKGAQITMNGGTLNTKDNFAIGTNGSTGQGGNTIIINGGKINANIKTANYEAIGVYLPNDDTFIMNDGEIVATGGAGIVQRGGSCTINGGSIIATGTQGATGYVGDNKTKMSQSAIIYHQSANYPAKDTMKLVITGGKLTGVDHSIEVLSNEAEPNVTVSGGTFNPAYPE